MMASTAYDTDDIARTMAVAYNFCLREAVGDLVRIALYARGTAIEIAWGRASTWGSYAALGLLGTFGGLWFLILPTIGASLACAHYGRKARDMRLVWRAPQVTP